MRALLVAALLAVASPARAEPPPAAVEAPTVTLKRETLELIMAEAATAEPTRQLLLDCQADAAKLAKADPQSTWWSGMKWAGVGALVIGAFAAGVWIGH
jgi:hypothetical protein